MKGKIRSHKKSMKRSPFSPKRFFAFANTMICNINRMIISPNRENNTGSRPVFCTMATAMAAKKTSRKNTSVN